MNNAMMIEEALHAALVCSDPAYRHIVEAHEQRKSLDDLHVMAGKATAAIRNLKESKAWKVVEGKPTETQLNLLASLMLAIMGSSSTALFVHWLFGW